MPLHLCNLACILVVLAVAGKTLSSDVRILVYYSPHSNFKHISDSNNYDIRLSAQNNEFVAIRTIQSESQATTLLDSGISKVIICNQPQVARPSPVGINPLSTRVRPGLTLMVELQLDKDDVFALRSIQTLETTKLEAIRARIASALHSILGVDAVYQGGRAPSDSAIDLSKLAVVSDQSVLEPPYYSFDLETNHFDLQRNVTSLHLYLYLPRLELPLNRDHIQLRTVLSSVETREQCLLVSKTTRVLVESGTAAGVEHVTLAVPEGSQTTFIHECQKTFECKARLLPGDNASGELVRGAWSAAIAINRTLNKSGFHRELVTQIRLSKPKNFDLDLSQCSLVFVETLSEDYYIDRDEVEGLERFEGNNHFDFFTNGIDIEKPAYTSTQHVVVVTYKNELSRDEGATYTVKYPIHLRYQMPSSTEETHRKTYINMPLVFLKCNNTVAISEDCKVLPHLNDIDLLLKQNKAKAAPSSCAKVTWTPLETDHVIEPLEVWIPTGQMHQDRMVTLLTFGSTSLAVLVISYFVYKSPSSIKQKGE